MTRLRVFERETQAATVRSRHRTAARGTIRGNSRYSVADVGGMRALPISSVPSVLAWIVRALRCFAVLGFALTCSSACGAHRTTGVLVAANAAMDRMGYGATLELKVTVAAHAGSRGDTTWHIEGNHLEFCRGLAARCERVATGPLTPTTFVVPHLTPVAQTNQLAPTAGVTELNGVWVRGTAHDLFDYEHAQMAFCWAADDVPQCSVVQLKERHFVSQAVAAVALSRPELGQTVWFLVDSVESAWLRGFMNPGGALARCVVTVSHPDPRCFMSSTRPSNERPTQ
jgi:hypothetical protein